VLLNGTTAIHGGSNAADALRCAKASDVITYRDNTHVITDYRYDSFGKAYPHSGTHLERHTYYL